MKKQSKQLLLRQRIKQSVILLRIIFVLKDNWGRYYTDSEVGYLEIGISYGKGAATSFIGNFCEIHDSVR